MLKHVSVCGTLMTVICVLFYFDPTKNELIIRQAYINTLRPRQNGRHFADDIFKRDFLNENIWIQIKISLKFVHKGPINNIPAMVQMMAWRRPGHNPLSEPMIVNLSTHICVTRPQWVRITDFTVKWIGRCNHPGSVSQDDDRPVICQSHQDENMIYRWRVQLPTVQVCITGGFVTIVAVSDIGKAVMMSEHRVCEGGHSVYSSPTDTTQSGDGLDRSVGSLVAIAQMNDPYVHTLPLWHHTWPSKMWRGPCNGQGPCNVLLSNGLGDATIPVAFPRTTIDPFSSVKAIKMKTRYIGEEYSFPLYKTASLVVLWPL